MKRAPTNKELRALAADCDRAAREAEQKWHHYADVGFRGDIRAMRRAELYEQLAAVCRELLEVREEQYQRTLDAIALAGSWLPHVHKLLEEGGAS